MLYIFFPLDFMVCLCDVFVFSLYIFTSHAQNQIAYINERNKAEVTETDFCSLNNGNEMKYPKSRTISLWYSHFFFCKTDQNCWKKYFMLIKIYIVFCNPTNEKENMKYVHLIVVIWHWSWEFCYSIQWFWSEIFLKSAPYHCFQKQTNRICRLKWNKIEILLL